MNISYCYFVNHVSVILILKTSQINFISVYSAGQVDLLLASVTFVLEKIRLSKINSDKWKRSLLDGRS